MLRSIGKFPATRGRGILFQGSAFGEENMRGLRLLLTVIFLTGCLGWAQETPTAATPAGDAKPSKATVYIYRYKEFVGSALEPSVYCDDVRLARMDNGRYFAVSIDPGKHAFHSNDKQSGVELDLKAGEQYFIRVEIAAGFMKGRGRLVLMSPQQASYELKSTNLKPLDASKVVDKDRVSVEEAHFEAPVAAPKASAPVAAVPKATPPSDATPIVSDQVIDSSGGTISPTSRNGDQISLGEAARRARLKKASATTAAPATPPQN
jgi:hypothetical protein